MILTDLRLIENYDGGEVVLRNNDLQQISGFQNMPYIGMFGGNAQSTLGPKVTEQTFDFWGNYLFHPNDDKLWINSLTENLLQNISLNSSTRIQIEETVKNDLEFMKEFAAIQVSVQLISVDKIRILIEIQEPDQQDSTIFSYLWSAIEKELTLEDFTSSDGMGIPLDLPLNFPI